MRKWLVYLALLTLMAAYAGLELKRLWQTPLAFPESGYVLVVGNGDSLQAVARRLHADGYLPHPQLVKWYGRWTGLDAQIKRGEYHLQDPITATELLLLLRSGRVIEYKVTIPEGITFAKALDILAAEDAITTTLAGPQDPRILALVSPYNNAEGWFFPDSYHFSRGATDWDIVLRAHSRMQKILQEQWQRREKDLPYETAYEALIMASIIERETGQTSERGEISGVFVRRMRTGMRLQTDPTVIYGLGDGYTGNLKRSHLKDAANTYNTYRHYGLPPTPIALPGAAAIHAALHPAAGETLYFVATGDGAHVFSKTLVEHNAAVRKYQLRRKSNYRSSPGKTQ